MNTSAHASSVQKDQISLDEVIEYVEQQKRDSAVQLNMFEI